MNRFGRRLAGAVALAALAGTLPSIADADTADPVTGGGEVIVRYLPGVSGDERAVARSNADVDYAATLLLPRTQVVSPEPGQRVGSAIAQLEDDTNVLYAEPNYVEQLDALPPNDPYASLEWALHNTGQDVNSVLGTAGADMKALAGWDIGSTSPGTITAVIDSGVAMDHPDLSGQLWTNPGETPGNGVDDDGNGFIDDVHGWDFAHGDNDPQDGDDHGTHTAGTIGAAGNNSIGITGVSQDATIMPLQVCPSVGGCPVSNQINAIAYAAAMGAKVANISIGGTAFSQSRRDAIAAAPGILFSVSAGNDGADAPAFGDNEITAKYPCQDDQEPGNPPIGNIICVAASDQFDNKAGFSNFGATSVDLAAPGVNIVSTFPKFETAFSNESFESLSPNWNFIASPGDSTHWERGTTIGRSGTGAITDSFSGNYGIASNATVTGSGVNLAGREGCRAEYWFKSYTESGTPPTSDWFFLEASHDPGGPWATIDAWRGTHQATAAPHYVFSADEGSTADLVTYEGDPSVFFRMRLQADVDIVTGDGAYVDDFKVRCVSPSTGSGLYVYKNGTSMAAPQVSGIASLVRELNPGLTAAETKQKILAGVDPVPAFSPSGPTPTVTGGRANIAGTLSTLDVTPPAVPELQSPAEGERIWGSPRFSWSFGEPLAENEMFLDGISTGVIGSGLSHAEMPLSPGRHTWHVTSKDEAGNTSTSGTGSFTYTRRPPVKIRAVRPRHNRRGGALAKVFMPGDGRVTVVAKAEVGSKGRRFRRVVVARGRARSPVAINVFVGLVPNAKGRQLLRDRDSLGVSVNAVFRGGNDPDVPGTSGRRGRLAAPVR